MKKNITGSILLWSIFLMIFISSAFIFVSVWIKKQIFSNKNIQNLIESYSSLNNKVESKNENIWENENLEMSYFDSFTWWLKQNEELNFSFLSSNTWSINILSWWPLYYKVFSGSLVYSSGTILTNDNIALNWSLYLKNLWWFTKLKIDFSTSSWIVFPYNYYKITKNIWWIDVLKDIWEVKK